MKHEIDKKYDSLDRIGKWDEGTREIIKKRIAEETSPNLSYIFLDQQEGEILEMLVDILIPQEKNDSFIKIPEIIDRELGAGKKGVRYGSDPWPAEFYKKGLAEISSNAKKIHGKQIDDFSIQQLNEFIANIFNKGRGDFLYRFMKKVLSDATSIYYSHPGSWNTIGFPGPAYPEGYPFLECDKALDWEPKYKMKEQSEE